MANKEDLRVRRTKAALFDAFIQLINAKAFGQYGSTVPRLPRKLSTKY